MSAITFSATTKFISVSIQGVPYQYQLGLYPFLKNIPGSEEGSIIRHDLSLSYDLSKISETKLFNAIRHALREHNQTEEQFSYRASWVFWAKISAPRPDQVTQRLALLELKGKDFISEVGWAAPSFHANAVRLVLTQEPDRSRLEQIRSIIARHLKL